MEQKQRRGIELQMPPAVIGHYGSAGGRVELGVDGMQAMQAVLEALHLRGLAQHGVEQAAHQLQHPRFKLVYAATGPPQAAMGQGKSPDALD